MRPVFTNSPLPICAFAPCWRALATDIAAVAGPGRHLAILATTTLNSAVMQVAQAVFGSGSGSFVKAGLLIASVLNSSAFFGNALMAMLLIEML